MILNPIPLRIVEIPSALKPNMLTGSTAIVIDVLRATTAMITALHNGAKAIYPMVNIDDAKAKKQEIADRKPLLCGEREGRMIPGFDLGNSPLEYSEQVVKNRILIWTTTNGTRALHAASKADKVLVAALLNIDVTVKATRQAAKPVVIVCAGTNGEPTLEDTVCAGLIAGQLCLQDDRFLTDVHCQQIIKLAVDHRQDVPGMFTQSRHGQYLQSIGFEQDLEFCARMNSINRQVGFQDNCVQ